MYICIYMHIIHCKIFIRVNVNLLEMTLDWAAQ